MKPITVPVGAAALAAIALFATAPVGLAEDTPAASPSPAVSGSAGKTCEHPFMHKLARLTPEERAKLKAARAAALKDPAVQAADATKGTARREYRKTLRAAMLKADPSIAPILEKLRPRRHQDQAS